MIGYYVHHQGSGHRHRAGVVQVHTQRCGVELTGLSTAPRPADWSGDWLELADDAPVGDAWADPPGLASLPAGRATDLTAHGRLHYVPTGSRGLSARMAAISHWLDTARPSALVVDVSVEVALLARLHGVPVVVVAQPGRRRDAAHRLGYDIASRIVAPWPAGVGQLWEGTAEDREKTVFVGAIGRSAPVTPPLSGSGRASSPVSGRVVVVNGTGGTGVDPADVARARRATPGWEWIHLDRRHGTWVDDPWSLLCSATVVVSHAGQNLLAEIAAARRPALLLPQPRPFDEQLVMAAAVQDAGLPVRVRGSWPAAEDWPELLRTLGALDGTRWSTWNDGGGAARMAALLAAVDAEGTAALGDGTVPAGAPAGPVAPVVFGTAAVEGHPASAKVPA